MSGNENMELKINGHGSAAGGTYKQVRINGHGKIEGDIVCRDTFVINGSGDAKGAVQADKLSINGVGNFEGDVEADTLKVVGTSTFKGDVKSDTLFSVSGTADLKAGLRAGKAKVSGSLWAAGDISAESFESSGSFQTKGLLSADIIDVRLHWSKSRAAEIGGETITVKSVAGLSALRSLFSVDTRLEADVIEGNDITLEHTRAKVVRGRNITLGTGCDIDVVEYSGELKRTGGPRVGQEKKV